MTNEINVIKLGQFSILHIASDPERIETKVVFDREDISQKLIFILMDITHTHGLGCSAPKFGEQDDPSMTFIIGTTLPNKSALKKYSQIIYNCLIDICDFAEDFNRQLDFSLLDLTMFKDVDPYGFYPEQLAAIRDQLFNGSWALFKKSLIAEKRKMEADIIEKCKKFEKINKKDIGLIGHKLASMVEMISNINHSILN